MTKEFIEDQIKHLNGMIAYYERGHSVLSKLNASNLKSLRDYLSQHTAMQEGEKEQKHYEKLGWELNISPVNVELVYCAKCGR